MPSPITIKQLHATTGEIVRRAGSARTPITITDRGEPVAVLASMRLLRPRQRQRTLLPEFAALMRRTAAIDVADDLDAVRGER